MQIISKNNQFYQKKIMSVTQWKIIW